MMIRNTNLRSLISTVRSLTLNVSPIRHVSGTPKGKAKLKAGQAPKKSTVSKKKKKSSDAPDPESRGTASSRAQAERARRLVESCASAPSPLRHLSPADRLREAERERLGLASGDKRRSDDGKSAPLSDEGDRPTMGTPGMDWISLGLVDADQVPEYELTAEDGKRLAKEYSRVLMRRHRARQKAETQFLRLKEEAVAAIPEGRLREAAMEPDFTPFPARPIAALTPPIEGYQERFREGALRSVGKVKMR
ncbi:hypothetical protein QJS04_geneDACA005963 [Acorus gramineus]|nr:hypothetical protein QJS04_geneDACA005963 [Acorus gramineus]